MKTNKLTLESVKAMRNDKKAKELCDKVTIMEKNENYIRYIVVPYKQRVMEKFDARDKETGEAIRDSEKLYLVRDEVAQACFDGFKEERKKSGLKVKEEGYCPLLVAEHETIKAKQEFVNYCAKYTGMDWQSLLCSGVKNCDRMVFITQKLFAEAA